MAGAVQETHRQVAFWSTRSSGLLRWFCVTGAALCMTWPHFFVASIELWTDGLKESQYALVRGHQLCTQLSIFEASLAELFHFWCCQLRKLRKSRRLASFLTLSSSKIEESRRLLRFWCCQVQRLRKSRRIAAFSSLHIDRKIDR